MIESMPPELTTGERIRLLRERRGMSRQVLAGLAGRGPDWLKKIENGERELRNHELLSRVALALKVDDLSILTGGPAAVPVDNDRVWVPAVAEIRDAVRAPLFGVPAERVEVDVLRGQVTQAWRLWHSSRFQRTEVGQLLPALLRDAQAVTKGLEGAERRRAHAVAADVYRLAQQCLAYGVEGELYWVVADRARTAALEADDPLSLAGAAWTYGNGLREAGYNDEAVKVVQDAADALRDRLDTGPDDLRGMYGALHLHEAVTRARMGQDGEAWRAFDTANRVADGLPTGYAHSWTVFGRGNADLHGVSVGVDLRTPGAAMERAESIDVASIPSVERQARVYIELARANRLRKDQSGALHWLNRAHESSPETLRFTPTARSLVADLVRGAKGPFKADAAALAERVGVLTA